MSVIELFECLPSNFKKIVKSGECPLSCKERGRYPSLFSDVRGRRSDLALSCQTLVDIWLGFWWETSLIFTPFIALSHAIVLNVINYQPPQPASRRSVEKESGKVSTCHGNSLLAGQTSAA